MRLPSIRNASKGFTLIELLVVAPVAIITIATLISLMVALVGDVAVSRERSVSSYDLQNALDRIEQDARIATTYLPTFSLFVSPQGENDGTAAFTSSSGDLIISQFSTTSDPFNSARKIVYYANQPYACASTYTLNRPMTNRVIYFTKTASGVTSLWRRVIVPKGSTSDTGTTQLCDNPWQRNSCSEAFRSTSPCETRDEKMLDYVSNFSTTYYGPSGLTTTDVRSATSIKVSLSQSKTVSGETISTTGVTRAFHVNTTTDEVPAMPTISVYNPDMNVFNNPILTTFTWDAVKSAAIYNVRYQINGGSWVNAPDQTGTQFQITTARPRDTIIIRVSAENDMGVSAERAFTYTTPLWTYANLQGDWECYDPVESGFACPAYTLSDSGLLLTRGLAKNGAPNSVIFTIPSGLTPKQGLLFPSFTGTDFTPIYAYGSGDIHYKSTLDPTAYVSLDTVRYIADGTPGITWTAGTPEAVNGWSNYGGGYGTAQFTKDASTRVSVIGLLVGTNAVLTKDSVFLRIATGFGPTNQSIWPQVSSPGNFHPIDRLSTSTFTMRGMGNANSFNSAVMTYYPSNSAKAFSAITPLSGWTNYSSPYNLFEYTKGADNVVTIRGLIKSGTTSYGTDLGVLPAGFRPGKRTVHLTAGRITVGGVIKEGPIRIDVLPTGEIRLMNPNTDAVNNGFLSVEGIHFYQEN